MAPLDDSVVASIRNAITRLRVTAVNAEKASQCGCHPGLSGGVWEATGSTVLVANDAHHIVTDDGPYSALDEAQAEHIAANGPASVLLRCDGALAITLLHDGVDYGGAYCGTCDEPFPCATLQNVGAMFGVAIPSDQPRPGNAAAKTTQFTIPDEMTKTCPADMMSQLYPDDGGVYGQAARVGAAVHNALHPDNPMRTLREWKSEQSPEDGQP